VPAGRDLVVRPERLQLAATPTDVPTGANSVQARVTGVFFQGTHQRAELDYGEGTTGCAVLSPDSMTGIRTGSTVTAYWDPGHQVLVTAPTDPHPNKETA
jgi:putative spermidine/putrescine transport system ATP-binding protein